MCVEFINLVIAPENHKELTPEITPHKLNHSHAIKQWSTVRSIDMELKVKLPHHIPLFITRFATMKWVSIEIMSTKQV